MLLLINLVYNETFFSMCWEKRTGLVACLDRLASCDMRFIQVVYSGSLLTVARPCLVSNCLTVCKEHPCLPQNIAEGWHQFNLGFGNRRMFLNLCINWDVFEDINAPL